MREKVAAKDAQSDETDVPNYWCDMNMKRPSFSDQMAYYELVARRRQCTEKR